MGKILQGKFSRCHQRWAKIQENYPLIGKFSLLKAPPSFWWSLCGPGDSATQQENGEVVIGCFPYGTRTPISPTSAVTSGVWVTYSHRIWSFLQRQESSFYFVFAPNSAVPLRRGHPWLLSASRGRCRPGLAAGRGRAAGGGTGAQEGAAGTRKPLIGGSDNSYTWISTFSAFETPQLFFTRVTSRKFVILTSYFFVIFGIFLRRNVSIQKLISEEKKKYWNITI